tara:strand:+ start:597 stop:2390 length:1794 start_codon:yes stop_codon:yes gene_type:complete
MMVKDFLEKKIPKTPGIYKFYNIDNEVIYIGKSKNLNNRIRSYFSNIKNHSNKTSKMIKEIFNISYTVSETEHDALLLENNLIKENKPKYNILLRDDKSYPYIAISKERFPRVYTTRKVNLKKEKVFGPYTNIKSMRNVLEIIKKIYKIRTCNLNLTKENIDNKLFKVCLDYHIGNCLGPCEEKQKEEDYMKDINQIQDLLKGNHSKLIKNLETKMRVYSKKLEFEKAQQIKEKIKLLKVYNNKSTVVNPKFKNIEVYGIIDDEKNVYVNYMKINNGIMLGGETIKLRKKIDLNESLIKYLIFHFKNKYKTYDYNIVSNYKLNNFINNIKVFYPKTGDKKKLIDLSLKNALFYKEHYYNEKKERKTKKYNHIIKLFEELKLKKLPRIIECFDISNTQGKYNTASMVKFKNGYPLKKDYRKYRIKSVDGINDYKSIEEVVERRYRRLISEKKTIPDLIVIDGGKGQLSSATKILKKLKIYNRVNIIGIAKKLEEVYFPEDSLPILINKKSESLKLLQKIRNEAHRFAIAYHKKLRNKMLIESSLDNIKGIGDKSKFKLIKEFGSIQKIDINDKIKLKKILGSSAKAEIIQKFIMKNKN